MCNCEVCRRTYKTFNEPWHRDSTREFKSKKNRYRKLVAKTRIKKLRQQKWEEIYNPFICRYTD